MTEEQFDFLHPMNVDSDGNVIFDDAGIAATSTQLSFSFSPEPFSSESFIAESFSPGRESGDLPLPVLTQTHEASPHRVHPAENTAI